MARKAAKAISYLRQMAGTAQTQLMAELGPNSTIWTSGTLNPKAFVQEHLFSDATTQATTAVSTATHATARTITTGNGVVATAMPPVQPDRSSLPTTPKLPDSTITYYGSRARAQAADISHMPADGLH